MGVYEKAALALATKEASKPIQQTFATRNCTYNQGLSDGTQQTVTYTIRHRALKNATDVSLVFGNFHANLGDIKGPNNITVKASIEVGGVRYPVSFDGDDSIVIKPGKVAETDKLPIEILEGAYFYSLTCVSVATLGEKWPLGITTTPANGEGKTIGDITVTGTPTTSFEFAYSPVAVRGMVKPSSNVLIVGDSIASGQGDSPNNLGYIVRALTAEGINHQVVSKGGEKAENFKGKGRIIRMSTISGQTHAIVEYIVNDIMTGRSVAALKADLLDIWTALAMRGLKLYQTTCTPTTTSTDAFVTTGNQAISNAANEARRKEMNDYIRTCPHPLTDFIDVADIVETSRNSGIWKAGITSDGIHPNVAGHALLAAKFDTALFK